ncbi:cyclin-U4-1 [Chlorella sorokiniana]|uniref:Cyclin-U4-1 n=1 Tax=Chlorella sorokiniana TaxID=3076 RepID=A0A2P6TWD6_CHLSO|nr:cyclin-U4-1 [Chlorella sorokiniana]|eukprot:PRW58377.1 cyclin-U4-1 [Chlorella sorokiniana]
MALALVQAGAAAAATAADVAERQHAWVQTACAVQLDSAGNVLTGIPQLLASAVERLVEAAALEDAMAPRSLQPTRLHGCRPPGISLDAYAARLLRYCKCSPVCFVAAFAYMARLQRGGGGTCGGALRVDALTAHRLMAVGCVVATKFFDDKYYANSHYAQVAGVSLRELNAMELDLLFRLDFRARVDSAELAEALTTMEALAAARAGCAAWPPLAPVAAPAPAFVAVPAAAACRPTLGRASPVAIAVARSASLGSDDGSSLTASARLAVAAPCELSDEDEELRACAASAAPAQPLPWVAASASAYAAAAAAAAVAAVVDAEAAAEDASQRTAPPRRSKKRCSLEAGELPGVRAMLVAREGEAAA